jgi:hypothetical protein
MSIDEHERFQRMIDETLAGVLAAQSEHALRAHLSTCAGCKGYLRASKRVIAGLGGFSFEVTPTLNARVLAAVVAQAEPARQTLARHSGARRQRNRQWRTWGALALAFALSYLGSELVYQVATRLAIPLQIDTARVQAGVLVFWLLPSICAAVCLLAAPGEKRGIA